MMMDGRVNFCVVEVNAVTSLTFYSWSEQSQPFINVLMNKNSFYRPHERNCEPFTVLMNETEPFTLLMKETWTFYRPHERNVNLLPSSWWTFYRPHERNCEPITVLMKETVNFLPSSWKKLWTIYRPHERNVNLLPSSWTKIPFTYSWRKLLRPPFTFNVLRIIWKRGNVQKNKSLKRRLNLSRS